MYGWYLWKWKVLILHVHEIVSLGVAGRGGEFECRTALNAA